MALPGLRSMVAIDLPDGDFWEPMSTLKAFLFYHVKWKAERKHRKAGI